jgi:hypothetical protein
LAVPFHFSLAFSFLPFAPFPKFCDQKDKASLFKLLWFACDDVEAVSVKR